MLRAQPPVQPFRQRPSAFRQEAARPQRLARLCRDPLRRRRAVPPGNQGIGTGREQRQVGLGDRLGQRDVPVAQTVQGRKPGAERRREAGRVLARDGVPVLREAHAVQERNRGCCAHVLPSDPPETARPCDADGAVGVARIPHVEIEKDAPQPVTDRAPGPARGARQRRQQEDDAEVGVRPDVSMRRPHRLQDHPADTIPSEPGEGGADGVGAEDEVAVGQARKVVAAADVPRLRGHDFQEARGLGRGGDHPGAAALRPAHRSRTAGRARRAAMRSTTRDATSEARSRVVVRCRALQPGIPFTSATSRPPTSLSSRSTPA